MSNLIIFLIGLAIMLVLMMKTKLGPLACMLLASLGIGLACGLGTAKTVSTITGGFAGTTKSIGLLVIFGTILGIYLEKSNACQQIATTLLRWVGKSNSTAAMAITGFIVAIPVFSDVALVLLSPLIKSVSQKSDKNPCMMGAVTACSLLSTNAFVAPTPAPLAVAAILGLDVATSIMYGLPVALFITIAVWAWGEFVLNKKPESWFTMLESEKERLAKAAAEENLDESQWPSFISSLIPILLPILLILVGSFGKALLPKKSAALMVLSFLGDKNIALAIGVAASILLLGHYIPEDKRWAPMNDALKVAGPIVFITASGGSLAQIVKATGVGTALANGMAASPIPVLLIPCLITGLSKFAQGSGSVAEIMAASLALPMCEAGLMTPLDAFLSVSAGASLGSHVNNSFTWVFSEFIGYDIKTTMKTLCVGQNVVMTLAGIIGMYVVVLLTH